MSRLLYRTLVVAALPVALALFVVRGLRGHPGERRGLSQRLGFGARHATRAIWVHAVSVGEVQAAAALVRALRSRYPDVPLTLTTTTGTGAARARETFGDAVDVRFLPFDSLGCVRRFLDRVRPHLAIIIEKELWPNLFGECAARGVPIVLASATVSARTVRRWPLVAPLFRDAFERSVLVAAQSEVDAGRFRQIGVGSSRVQIVGNLKFDLSLSPQLAVEGGELRTACGWKDRLVLVGGSTYEPEENALLEVQGRLRSEGVDVALVLAPRHPSRFEAVASRLQSAGVAFSRRSRLTSNSGMSGESASSSNPASASPDVLLLDTLGELMSAYAAADLAFVGGSLVDGVGGHNLIEPAALAVATLTGPRGYNAPDIAAALQTAGALTIVRDTESLLAEVRTLATSAEERSRRGALGRAFVEENRGTIERLLARLEPLMADSSERSSSANR
jgi:3-deoxy-D-manno-octulosonic-acid transferase